MDSNHIINKHNATVVQDENNKYKSYVVLDGYVVALQYNFG